MDTRAAARGRSDYSAASARQSKGCDLRSVICAVQPTAPAPSQLTQGTWRRVTPGSQLLALPEDVQCSIAAALLALASRGGRHLKGARALLSLRTASRQAAGFGLGAVSNLQLQLALLEGQSLLVTSRVAQAEGWREWDPTWCVGDSSSSDNFEEDRDADCFVQDQLSLCEAVQSAAASVSAQFPDLQPVLRVSAWLRKMREMLERIQRALRRQARKESEKRERAWLQWETRDWPELYAHPDSPTHDFSESDSDPGWTD